MTEVPGKWALEQERELLQSLNKKCPLFIILLRVYCILQVCMFFEIPAARWMGVISVGERQTTVHQVDMMVRYGTLAQSKEIYLKSYRFKKKKEEL